MKLSPAWLREFVDARVDDRRLAQDLTAVGIAVESISGDGKNAVFEMEIGTNRPDAMNHYGVAREASVIYNLPLRAVDSKLPAAPGNSDFAIEIADQAGCARYTARDRPRCKCQTISRCDGEAAAAGRSAPHQQCGGRYQLHAVGDGTSHPRFRSRSARGRQDSGAAGVQRRDPENAGRRRAQTYPGRSGHRRCREASRAGRSHGRIRHHDYGEDEKHPDRVGLV